MAALLTRDSKRILGIIDSTLSPPLLDYMLGAQQQRPRPSQQPQSKANFLTWVQGQDESSSSDEEDYFFPAPASIALFVSGARLPWDTDTAGCGQQPAPRELRFSLKP
jgi:hypothetical protein